MPQCLGDGHGVARELGAHGGRDVIGDDRNVLGRFEFQRPGEDEQQGAVDGRLAEQRRSALRVLVEVAGEHDRRGHGADCGGLLDRHVIILIGSRPAQVGDAAKRHERNSPRRADLRRRRRLHVG